MLKKILLSALSCALLFLLAACNNPPAEPENKAVAPAAPAATPSLDIHYGAGFYDQESTPDGQTWRWMAETGGIRLKNKGVNMRLKLVGDMPADQFKGAAKLTIKFNGEQLDQFIATKTNFRLEKEFTIPAAKQGGGEFSELTFQSDKFFIPKLVDNKSNDERKLSFSLSKLEWAAK